MTSETTAAGGDSGDDLAALVAGSVLDVPDFPKPGIAFKDLMPLFADGPVFRKVIDGIIAFHGAGSFDVVAGVEARGFVVAAAIAYATGTGVVPMRKAGKLPRPVFAASYALEYGEATLEVHQDAFVRRPAGAGGRRRAGHRGNRRRGPRSGGSRPAARSRASPCCWSWVLWVAASGSPPVRSMRS